ncbi:MAG TPA: cyclase family protein [Candidatus Nanoarchaeia archaeon]|nr:cyclase family protein [Candidatus Nanoarchaeia archaeon]
MKVIDISMTIHPEMEIYNGDVAPKIKRIFRIEDGDSYNVSKITMGSHTGTHVDSPLHFFLNKTGVDELPLQGLVGPARVIDISGVKRPFEAYAHGSLENVEIILLKGQKAHLSIEGALFLIENNVRTIGTEALSIAADEVENEVHRILLRAEIIIIEGLDLSNVNEGDYFLVCLPLKIAGCDGAPARAVLISDL